MMKGVSTTTRECVSTIRKEWQQWTPRSILFRIKHSTLMASQCGRIALPLYSVSIAMSVTIAVEKAHHHAPEKRTWYTGMSHFGVLLYSNWFTGQWPYMWILENTLACQLTLWRSNNGKKTVTTLCFITLTLQELYTTRCWWRMRVGLDWYQNYLNSARKCHQYAGFILAICWMML